MDEFGALAQLGSVLAQRRSGPISRLLDLAAWLLFPDECHPDNVPPELSRKAVRVIRALVFDGDMAAQSASGRQALLTVLHQLVWSGGDDEAAAIRGLLAESGRLVRHMAWSEQSHLYGLARAGLAAIGVLREAQHDAGGLEQNELEWHNPPPNAYPAGGLGDLLGADGIALMVRYIASGYLRYGRYGSALRLLRAAEPGAGSVEARAMIDVLTADVCRTLRRHKDAETRYSTVIAELAYAPQRDAMARWCRAAAYNGRGLCRLWHDGAIADSAGGARAAQVDFAAAMRIADPLYVDARRDPFGLGLWDTLWAESCRAAHCSARANAATACLPTDPEQAAALLEECLLTLDERRHDEPDPHFGYGSSAVLRPIARLVADAEWPPRDSLLNNLGNALRVAGHHPRAKRMFTEVLRPHKRPVAEPERIHAYAWFNFARLLADEGKVQEAISMAARAADWFGRQARAVANSVSERDAAALVDFYASDVDLLLTLATSTPALDAESMTAVADALVARKGLVLHGAGLAHAVRGVPGDAALARASRAYRDATLLLSSRSAAAARQAADGQAGAQAGHWSDEALLADLADLAEEQQAAEGELRRLVERLGPGASPVRAGLSDIQRSMHPNEILVDIHRYRKLAYGDAVGMQDRAEEWYCALVVAKGAEPTIVDLGSAAEIDGSVETVRRHLIQYTRTEGKQKVQYFMDPAGLRRSAIRLAESLPGNMVPPTVDHVIWSPDGALNRLPLEHVLGLAMDDAGDQATSCCTHSYVTSAQDLPGIRHGHRPGCSTDLILAALDYKNAEGLPKAPGKVDASAAGPSVQSGSRAELEPLHWSRAEAGSIGAHLPGATLLDDALGTEDRIRAVHSPRILHLSTHGKYGSASELCSGVQDPRVLSRIMLSGATRSYQEWQAAARPGQAPSDGELTGLDVSTLDLQGTELVVLSACESGVGENHRGEGVWGLRRAFQQAGARSLVVSLWSVDDAATTILMGRFYQALVGNLGDDAPDGWDGEPMSRSAALAEAQRYVRSMSKEYFLEDWLTDERARMFVDSAKLADDQWTVELLRERASKLADPPFAHPFYWAGFILQGATEPLFPPKERPGTG